MPDLKINIIARDKTRKAFNGVQAGLGRLKSSVFSVQAALIGIGAGLLIKSLVSTGREIEQLEIKFNFLFQSTKKGGEAFKALTSFAARVPFSLEKISAASGNLATITSVAEGGAKELTKVLEITGNVAAVTGLDFQQTAEQIQRSFSSGVASADIFRERGVTAMLGFQQGARVSAEETAKRFEEVFGKDGKFGKATEVMSTTFTGTLSMLGDKLFKFKMDTNQGGFFDFLKVGLARINRMIENNEELLSRLAESLSTVLIKSIKFILMSGASLADLLKKPFKVVADAVKGLMDVMALLPPAVQSMGLIGFLMLGTKGRLAIIGIGWLIKKLGIDMKALAEKIGINAKETDNWGTFTKSMSGYLKELDNDMKSVSGQNKEIYEILGKNAKASKEWKENTGLIEENSIEILKNIEQTNEKFSISNELTKLIQSSVKSFSKSLAESLVYGKKLNASLKELAQKIMVQILERMIERLTLLGIEKVLEIAIAKWQDYRKRQIDAQNQSLKQQIALQAILLAMGGGGGGGSMFSFFQHGGAIRKGQPAIVGERGPEVFIPNTSGQITQSARGTGGGSTNVNFSITTLDASGFSDMLVQNRGTISNIINQAVNERGSGNIV